MELSTGVQPVPTLPVPHDPSTLTTSQGGHLHYKYGKQSTAITLQHFIDKMTIAAETLDLECLAYLWMLFWCGCRKSELYERIANDIVITDTSVYIDFHQRKKHSAITPPIEFPRSYPGVDIFVEWYSRIASRPDTRKQVWDCSNKTIKIANDKKKYLFPHIQSTKAWYLVKHTLGEQYYPHFFRLNRLTDIGSDPTANYVRIKSFSGLKTMKAIETYLGVVKKEADAAVSFSGREVANVKMLPDPRLRRTVPNIASNTEVKS